MKKLKIIVLSTLLALITSSCATIFSGTKDSITFKSNPPNADVYINGVEVGKSGNTIVVKRKTNAKTVTYKLDGYEDVTFNFETKPTISFYLPYVSDALLITVLSAAYYNHPVIVLPLFAVGFTSRLVDDITGAKNKPATNYYEKTLIPKKTE